MNGSIPATHNSPTYYNAPPSVRCQAVSPWEQLQNGVRFFDLRVQVPEPFDINNDRLVLVHSVFPISLTGNKVFRELYDDILKFLRENPSETLIMSLKREGSGKGTDEQLSQLLKKHYTNPEQWFTQPRVPKLGEARGKIVLVRRFNLEESLKREWDGKGWGIDADGWADNTDNSTCPSGDVCVQDFYQVDEPETIRKKIDFARAHLERSGCCRFSQDGNPGDGKKYPLFINFLSASNFFKVGTWPEKVAAEVNPEIVKHLCHQHMVKGDGGVNEGDWSTGIVVMDWVGLAGGGIVFLLILLLLTTPGLGLVPLYRWDERQAYSRWQLGVGCGDQGQDTNRYRPSEVDLGQVSWVRMYTDVIRLWNRQDCALTARANIFPGG